MHGLREKLAAAAARLIVEDGLDYAGAKRRAVHQLLGPGARTDQQPDNDDIRAEVETYLALFRGDTHPALLWNMRRAALSLMETFAEFRPYLAGAVWNGTATEHSGVHVLLFTDDAKGVDIRCIDLGIAFRAGQAPHYAGRQPVERLEFDWPMPERDGWVAAGLSVYPAKDERGVLQSGERGSLQALRARVAAGPDGG